MEIDHIWFSNPRICYSKSTKWLTKDQFMKKKIKNVPLNAYHTHDKEFLFSHIQNIKTVSLALVLENVKWLNEGKTCLQTQYI